MDTEWIEALGGQQCADSLVLEAARERASGARRLLLIGQWALLHNPATIQHRYDAAGRILPGTEQARGYGGDGTPEVAEFAVHELALLLGLPETIARGQLADVLDLQHRHPRLWARVRETAGCDAPGRDPALAAEAVQAWQACWVARRCRHTGLSAEAARWVDARTTRDLGRQAWSRFQDTLEARIKAADPALAEQRRRAKEASKRLTVSRTNTEGMKTLTVQLPAAQIILMRARIHQLALILKAAHAAAQATSQTAGRDAGQTAGRDAGQTAGRDAGQAAGRDAEDSGPGGVPQQVPGIGLLEADAAFLLCTNPLDALHRLLAAVSRRPTAPGPAPGPGAESAKTPKPATPQTSGSQTPAPCPDGEHQLGGTDDLDDPAGAFDDGDDPRKLFDDRPVKDREPHTRNDDDQEPGAPPDPAPDPDAPPDPDPEPDPMLVPESAVHPSQRDEPCPTCGHDPTRGRGQDAAPSQADLAGLDAGRLRPGAVVYLHASETEFRGGRGVVRCENDGHALTPQEAIDLLGHCHVTITRVIDLNDHHPVDAYEIPARIAAQVRLAWPTTVFPYSATSSRAAGVDLDHNAPYRPPAAGGPPGQTGLHNLTPLSRASHRVKTHGPGWTTRQPAFGLHLWRTPHGYCFQHDAYGTTPLGKMTHHEFTLFTRELAEHIAWDQDDEPAATSILDTATA